MAQAESSFSFGLERQVLVGKIDLLRHHDGGYELVDFKTGKSVPAALEEVDVQLDLYALGAELSLKVPVVQQGVHFLGDDEVFMREWSPERAVSARERLGTVVDLITQQEFPPKSEYCPRCDEFRAICPYAGGVR